jgi:hypothetical protein
MWFECSECGGHVNRPSAPAVCPECGVAGAIFTSADPDDLTAADWDGGGLRVIWLRAGLEQPGLVAEA